MKIFFILSAFSSLLAFNPSPGFTQEQDKEQILPVEVFPQHIAEAQWATVEKLQKLLEEKKYPEALLCFSEKIRVNIKSAQDKDSNYLVFFFEQWTLNEETKKNYKGAVFSGRAYFIYDVNDQEWKINEN